MPEIMQKVGDFLTLGLFLTLLTISASGCSISQHIIDEYMVQSNHKAFAEGPGGAWGYFTEADTRAEGILGALVECNKFSSFSCELVNVDGVDVSGEEAERLAEQARQELYTLRNPDLSSGGAGLSAPSPAPGDARTPPGTTPEAAPPSPAATAPRPGDFGQYHALVIAIGDYRHLADLETPIPDGRAVADLLKARYGFQTRLIENPSRRQILTALNDLRQALGENDNLLIYYAGHGWLDEAADAGYWLPPEAEADNNADWISMSSITAALRAMRAKHVMVVADSCYSGRLVRGVEVMGLDGAAAARLARRRARVALTSGGLEPVVDDGGGGHSVFAAAFLKALRENNGLLEGTRLFERIRRPVMLEADQIPEYADIRMAGHDGGDFIFAPAGP